MDIKMTIAEGRWYGEQMRTKKWGENFDYKTRLHMLVRRSFTDQSLRYPLKKFIEAFLEKIQQENLISNTTLHFVDEQLKQLEHGRTRNIFSKEQTSFRENSFSNPYLAEKCKYREEVLTP